MADFTLTFTLPSLFLRFIFSLKIFVLLWVREKLCLKSNDGFSLTQDFCRPNDWPPIKELKTAISKDGQSCEFACLDKGLVCEPTFFPLINTRDTFKR